MSSAIQLAAHLLGSRARHLVPLGPLTTYRVGGAAALLVTLDHDADVAAVASAVAHSGVDVVIVGRGSNLLVADDGVEAVVVMLGALGEGIHIDATTVRVGGAVRLPVLARRTVASGLTGLEWAVGVPGTVGGAVRMNAGGHGSDVASTLTRVEVADLESGDRRWLDAQALGLRFRGSDVAGHQVVIAAEFALQRGESARGEAELAEIVRWRRQHQPGGQNAGSVFVNPIPGQVSAGELIDAAGLRGLRRGSAEVSPKHANFIQADEGGTASDVVALMLEVRSAVAAHCGVWLRSELRLVGFAPDVVAQLGATAP